MPSPESQGPFEEILREHASLRDHMDRLRQMLAARKTEVADPEPVSWSTSLTSQVTSLHEKLVRHFRDEEEPGGALEQLSDHHPRASGRMEKFKEEHLEILDRIRALLSDTLEASERTPLDEPNLGERLGSILDTLARHEHDETDFLSRTESEDIGGGD